MFKVGGQWRGKRATNSRRTTWTVVSLPPIYPRHPRICHPRVHRHRVSRRRHALGSICLCRVRHIRIRPNTSMFNATRWGFNLTGPCWVVALVDNVVVGLLAVKLKLRLVNTLGMESFIKRQRTWCNTIQNDECNSCVVEPALLLLNLHCCYRIRVVVKSASSLSNPCCWCWIHVVRIHWCAASQPATFLSERTGKTIISMKKHTIHPPNLP